MNAESPSIPAGQMQYQLQANTETVSNVVGGYYFALPPSYNSGKKFPVFVFLHGAGHYGNGKNDLPMLLNDGLAQQLDEGKMPVVYKAGDHEYSFIFICPQFSQFPSGTELKEFLDHVLSSYQVDTSRIYLGGFSTGGIISCDYAAMYGQQLAAIVPISGVSRTDGFLRSKVSSIAASGMSVWIFHNVDDQVIPVSNSTSFYDGLKSYNANVRLSLLEPFGLLNHDAWTRATDPLYKEDGMNIYEWMLGFTR